MLPHKLKLAGCFTGTAAMAAFFVGQFQQGETPETPVAPDQDVIAPLTQPEHHVALHEQTPGFAEGIGGGGGMTDSSGKPLYHTLDFRKPDGRKGRFATSEALFAFANAAGPTGASGSGEGQANDAAETETKAEDSSADEAAGAEGGGGSGHSDGNFHGGGGGGGPGLGGNAGLNPGGSLPNFFLVADSGDNTMPPVESASGSLGPGNDSASEAPGQEGDDTSVPNISSGDNEGVVTTASFNSSDKNAFGDTPDQYHQQGATAPGLTTDDDESGDENGKQDQDPKNDRPRPVRVPDNASVLGLISFSMLGLAGLRRRIAG